MGCCRREVALEPVSESEEGKLDVDHHCTSEQVNNAPQPQLWTIFQNRDFEHNEPDHKKTFCLLSLGVNGSVHAGTAYSATL